MIGIGFTLMLLTCTPQGCGFEPYDEVITTKAECMTDAIMNTVEDQRLVWECAEVFRDKEEQDGTAGYFRGPFREPAVEG